MTSSDAVENANFALELSGDAYSCDSTSEPGIQAVARENFILSLTIWLRAAFVKDPLRSKITELVQDFTQSQERFEKLHVYPNFMSFAITKEFTNGLIKEFKCIKVQVDKLRHDNIVCGQICSPPPLKKCKLRGNSTSSSSAVPNVD